MTSSFYDAWKEPEYTPGPPVEVADIGAYAQSALTGETNRVAGTPQGSRNLTLFKAAANLGELIASGHLDEPTVDRALTWAARVAGLDDRETAGTLRSGLTTGKQHPRIVTERNGQWPPPTTSVTNVSPGNATNAGTSKGGATAPVTPTTPTPPTADQPPSPPGTAIGVNATSAAATPASTDATTELVHDQFPAINWHDLWAEDDEEEEWIIEPLLPARRLVALYSAPKLGKSLLMLEVATRVAQGHEVLGVTPDRPRRVLYVDFENDPRGDIRSRLLRLGVTPADLDGLCFLSYPRLAKLDTPQGGQQLMACVDVYQCEVVVIDTISRAVGGEENDNDTWLSFYRSTGMLLKAAGISCIRLDHTGKDADRGMRGGSAKYGDVDAVWRLTAVTDTMLRLDCTDSRMPITEKTLVLTRHNIPRLWHQVQADGALAAHKAKVAETVAVLDAAGAPDDMGRRKARELTKAAGWACRNDTLEAALKQRQARLQPFGGTLDA